MNTAVISCWLRTSLMSSLLLTITLHHHHLITIQVGYCILFFFGYQRWYNSQCTGLWIERLGFRTWPGHCVVFLENTLLSVPLTTQEYKWIMVSGMSGKPDEMLGGNCFETRSFWVGHMGWVQTNLPTNLLLPIAKTVMIMVVCFISTFSHIHELQCCYIKF